LVLQRAAIALNSKTKIVKQILTPLLAALLLTSCGPSTKIVKSWSDPNATLTHSASNKVLIVAMVKDESSRRVIEDELAKRLKSPSVQSYTMLTPEVMKLADSMRLEQILIDGKFTHILLMRLADVEKELSYVPGTTTGFYGGYGMYYGYGAGFYSSPGYYTTDKKYSVETAVYTINPNKLIWTSVTETLNPSDLNKSINEIADVVSSKMKKDGFLK
jgi:hypothetical protein